MQISDPDVRLMLAFRKGDDSALAALYRRWAGPLLRYLERIVSERATAEELLQEAFIRVHGARERYTPEARFSTWLFRIGRNLALNELDRAHRRMPHVVTDTTDARSASHASGDSTGPPALSLVSSRPSALDEMETRRTASRLEFELGRLPERQQSALWLAAVEGYSYDEIAGVLGTSNASVKALVHRARATLADRMQREAELPAENRR